MIKNLYRIEDQHGNYHGYELISPNAQVLDSDDSVYWKDLNKEVDTSKKFRIREVPEDYDPCEGPNYIVVDYMATPYLTVEQETALGKIQELVLSEEFSRNKSTILELVDCILENEF